MQLSKVEKEVLFEVLLETNNALLLNMSVEKQEESHLEKARRGDGVDYIPTGVEKLARIKERKMKLEKRKELLNKLIYG